MDELWDEWFGKFLEEVFDQRGNDMRVGDAVFGERRVDRVDFQGVSERLFDFPSTAHWKKVQNRIVVF